MHARDFKYVFSQLVSKWLLGFAGAGAGAAILHRMVECFIKVNKTGNELQNFRNIVSNVLMYENGYM